MKTLAIKGHILVTQQVMDLTDRYKQRMKDKDRGATAVEYGLIVALIAVVIIVAVALLGRNIRGVFNKAASTITG